MKLIGVCLGAVLLAVLLLGCPYQSDVPLGAPQTRVVDTWLTGYWVADSTNEEGEQGLLEILPFNGTEYVFACTGRNSEPEYYRAFQVSTGKERFWNFAELDETGLPTAYYIGYSTLGSDGRLSIRLVDEDGVPKELGSDMQALANYLDAHVNDSALYDEESGALMRRPMNDEMENGRLRIWGD